MGGVHGREPVAPPPPPSSPLPPPRGGAGGAGVGGVARGVDLSSGRGHGEVICGPPGGCVSRPFGDSWQVIVFIQTGWWEMGMARIDPDHSQAARPW